MMTDWLAAEKELAARLYREGLSCRAIGERLGKSRSAVVAKLSRMDVITRKADMPKSTASSTSKPVSPRLVVVARPVDPATAERVERRFSSTAGRDGLPWTERAFGECAFPTGDGRSCCAAVESGKAYCPEHCAVVYDRRARPARSARSLEGLARMFA